MFTMWGIVKIVLYQAWAKIEFFQAFKSCSSPSSILVGLYFWIYFDMLRAVLGTPPSPVAEGSQPRARKREKWRSKLRRRRGRVREPWSEEWRAKAGPARKEAKRQRTWRRDIRRSGSESLFDEAAKTLIAKVREERKSHCQKSVRSVVSSCNSTTLCRFM